MTTFRTWLWLALLVSGIAHAAEPSIAVVTLDRPWINAVLGDSVRIAADVPAPGTLNAFVLDRDGVIVRTLAKDATVARGRTVLVWNGRDDRGEVVPDEAYSLKFDWTDGRARASYFPANRPARMDSVPIHYYDRRSGTLSFELARPSRVHIQAGSAVANAKTRVMEGPVMKTIINREPRVAGKIAEHWNGLDESGTTYIPDLPNFVIAIAATPLPESSIITTGNRKRVFLDVAAARAGGVASLFTPHEGPHMHHAGLSALDDVSPGMLLEPVGGTYSESDRVWLVGSRDLQLRVTLTGPAAAAFARQPAKIHRFVDLRLQGTAPASGAPAVVRIPRAKISAGTHLISVNWQSEYGGVAANSIRVRLDPARAASATAGGGRP